LFVLLLRPKNTVSRKTDFPFNEDSALRIASDGGILKRGDERGKPNLGLIAEIELANEPPSTMFHNGTATLPAIMNLESEIR
jgi:hypothetical protein